MIPACPAAFRNCPWNNWQIRCSSWTDREVRTAAPRRCVTFPVGCPGSGGWRRGCICRGPSGCGNGCTAKWPNDAIGSAEIAVRATPVRCISAEPRLDYARRFGSAILHPSRVPALPRKPNHNPSFRSGPTPPQACCESRYGPQWNGSDGSRRDEDLLLGGRTQRRLARCQPDSQVEGPPTPGGMRRLRRPTDGRGRVRFARGLDRTRDHVVSACVAESAPILEFVFSGPSGIFASSGRMPSS